MKRAMTQPPLLIYNFNYNKKQYMKMTNAISLGHFPPLKSPELCWWNQRPLNSTH